MRFYCLESFPTALACRMKEAGCLPLQWELHSGDQTEVDQILHQGLLVLQAVDDSAAAGQLQVLPTGRRHFLQLGQRLRLHDLRVRAVGQSVWLCSPPTG